MLTVNKFNEQEQSQLEALEARQAALKATPLLYTEQQQALADSDKSREKRNHATLNGNRGFSLMR